MRSIKQKQWFHYIFIFILISACTRSTKHVPFPADNTEFPAIGRSDLLSIPASSQREELCGQALPVVDRVPEAEKDFRLGVTLRMTRREKIVANLRGLDLGTLAIGELQRLITGLGLRLPHTGDRCREGPLDLLGPRRCKAVDIRIQMSGEMSPGLLGSRPVVHVSPKATAKRQR